MFHVSDSFLIEKRSILSVERIRLETWLKTTFADKKSAIFCIFPALQCFDIFGNTLEGWEIVERSAK